MRNLPRICLLVILIISPIYLLFPARAQTNFLQQTKGPDIRTLAINQAGHIFAGVENGGIFRSMDNGQQWIPINNGIPASFAVVLAINSVGHIFAGISDGVFRSTNNGEGWSEINNGLIDSHGFANSIFSFAINSNGDLYAGGYGVFRSTDNGDSWSRV